MSYLADLRASLGSDGITCLIVVLVAALVAFAFTPIARVLALHHGATDNPSARRIHDRVIPRLGGLAVLAAILCATWLGTNLWSGTALEQLTMRHVIIPITLVATMVCLLGALDDLAPISPLGKIGGLSAAGFLLAIAGVSIDFVSLPLVGRVELGALAVPATIVWIVLCANAVNLIDGVDGSGPGVVTISSFGLMSLSLGLGDFPTGLLFAATCGAACGFLIHNRQPATIFLGDSGSLLLGFMLAATSAAGCTKRATALTLIGALVALAVPFLDATQSFLRRFLASLRRDPGRLLRRLLRALRATAIADLGHIHHRLLRRGMSHSEVAFTICLATMVTSLSVLLFLPTGQVHWSSMLAVLLSGAFVLARLAWIRVPAGPPASPVATPTVAAPAVDAPGPQGMGAIRPEPDLVGLMTDVSDPATEA